MFAGKGKKTSFWIYEIRYMCFSLFFKLIHLFWKTEQERGREMESEHQAGSTPTTQILSCPAVRLCLQVILTRVLWSSNHKLPGIDNYKDHIKLTTLELRSLCCDKCLSLCHLLRTLAPGWASTCMISILSSAWWGNRKILFLD